MKTALETSEETLKVTLVEVCSFVSVSNFKFVTSKTQKQGNPDRLHSNLWNSWMEGKEKKLVYMSKQ